MSHIQYPLISGLRRGVMRIRREPLAHSGFAFCHALVLQPFEHSVQVVSTTPGLSQGRLLNRYSLVVIAPTGHTSIRLPERSEWTPSSRNVAISLPLPRSAMLICASPSISRMKRTHRVQRMQRLRLSISVGPKSTSALDPLAIEDAPREVHPAFRGAEAVGEILQRTLAALVAHRAVERVVDEQELEDAGSRLRRLRIARRHDHAVGADRRARGLQLRHLLDLDDADAAGAVDGQAGMKAVVGN